MAKIHIENTDIALVSLYAPNVFVSYFYEQITKILLDLSDFKFIIGADFNAVVGHSLDRSGRSENKKQKQLWSFMLLVKLVWWICGVW